MRIGQSGKFCTIIRTSFIATFIEAVTTLTTHPDFSRGEIPDFQLGPDSPFRYFLTSNTGGTVDFDEVTLDGERLRAVNLAIPISTEEDLCVAQVDDCPSTESRDKLPVDAGRSFVLEAYARFGVPEGDLGFDTQYSMGFGLWNVPYQLEARGMQSMLPPAPMKMLWFIRVSRNGVMRFNDNFPFDQFQAQFVNMRSFLEFRKFSPFGEIPFAKTPIEGEANGLDGSVDPYAWHKYEIELKKAASENGQDLVIYRVDGQDVLAVETKLKGRYSTVFWVDNNVADADATKGRFKMAYGNNPGNQVSIAGARFRYND